MRPPAPRCPRGELAHPPRGVPPAGRAACRGPPSASRRAGPGRASAQPRRQPGTWPGPPTRSAAPPWSTSSFPAARLLPVNSRKLGPVTPTRSRSPINTTRADISAPQLVESRLNQYIFARQNGQSGRRPRSLFRSSRPPVLSRPLVLLPERRRSADPTQDRAPAAFGGAVGPGMAEGFLPTHALEGRVRRRAQESAEGATKRWASARTRQVIGEDLVVGGLEHLGHAVRPGDRPRHAAFAHPVGDHFVDVGFTRP